MKGKTKSKVKSVVAAAPQPLTQAGVPEGFTFDFCILTFDLA